MKNALRTLFLCTLCTLSLPLLAEHDWIRTAQLETRIDHQRAYDSEGQHIDDRTGFSGSFVNLILKGEFAPKFSYAYRQRFSKAIKNGHFLDATDYLYITYAPTERWSVAAGKKIMHLGGFEYDYAPIDVYRYSEYCNQVSSYQFGASATYSFQGGKDQLTAQFVQSPFHYVHNDMYGYNLYWSGHHGFYSSLWSVSALEYSRGRFVNYVALGNRFDFNLGHLILDYTNRFSGGYHASYFGDQTFSAELHIQPIKELNVFGKYAFDRNEENGGDLLVMPGTKLHSMDIGIEYRPIKGQEDLRLHADYGHTWGTNSNPDGVLQGGENYMNVGLTWRLDFLKLAKKRRCCSKD